MPKRVQDIIPTGHRSIRDIPLDEIKSKPSTNKRSRGQISDVKEKGNQAVRARREDGKNIENKSKEDSTVKGAKNKGNEIEIERIHFTPPTPAKPKKRKSPWIIGIILVLAIVIGLAIAGSAHFAKATFTISLKTAPVAVNNMSLVIPASASSTNALTYKLINVVSTANSTVGASLGPQTDTKAGGTITIYNIFGIQPQRLVAGTRLTNDTGLVYRLTSTVSVPGYKQVGTNKVPGSIDATIVADESGSKYNISHSDSISDFKVIAYKGLPTKYDDFYGRLSTDITGGFSGRKLVVDPNTIASTTSIIQTKLLAQLQQKLIDIVPKGYVLYSNSTIPQYSTPDITNNASSSAQISITATLYGIILNKTNLASILAGTSSTAVFGGTSFDTPGLENISFNIANIKDFLITKKNPIVAKVSGSFKLVGIISIDTLKTALAGNTLETTANILKKYANSINLTNSFGEITPPWVNTVPKDTKQINIVFK